jgi:hypothetical protein
LRTSQYAFIFTLQVLILCAMMTFGVKVIDLSHYRDATNVPSDVKQSPSEQEKDSLVEYLSR